MTKKRRATTSRAQISASRRRCALSEADVRVPNKRSKCHIVCKHDTPSCSGVSADAVAHFQALQPASSSCSSSSSSATALAEVYEWLGDAVIGELVGRCLLSQFHRAPLSARVFRNLRLAVVTNRNLAQVYDAMGYAGSRRRNAIKADATQIWRPMKMKERADVVEAVVGELVLRLHAQRMDRSAYAAAVRATGAEAAYCTHLDAVLAAMLHAHFVARTRAAGQYGETTMAAKGPLSVAFNPFACLPEELLDETTGELVVHDGVFEQELLEEDEAGERSATDLIEEYKGGETLVDVGGQLPEGPHHCFRTHCIADSSAVERGDAAGVVLVMQLTRKAMLELDASHVLCTSSEIFEVFKIYGMAVLAERVSLALTLPHVPLSSQHRTVNSGDALVVTPARLTRQRQLALSMANLATCAVELGIALSSSSPSGEEESSDESEEEAAARRVLDERRRANTLRAFVGFHSTVATTSSTVATRHSSALVNAICKVLLDSGASSRDTAAAPLQASGMLAIPDREPLVALMQSVGEARVFMNSKTCSELHTKGERPVSVEMRKRKQSPNPLLLRQCDSEQVEDLFETLAREQDQQRRAIEAKAAGHHAEKIKEKRRRKKVHLPMEPATANLTANLERFLHRRFLFCLEEIVVLFAQRKTQECRSHITSFQHDLEPCVNELQFHKWEVSTSTLTLAMRDSFYRLLLHDVCQFHAVVSSSRNTRDGTRITQLRLPLHYTWANVSRRITTEQQARC